MKRAAVLALATVLVAAVACSKKDPLSDYSLGTEAYPNQADCKQVYYKDRPIRSVFLKKLVKAQGAERLEGIACHGVNIVIDVKTGNWTEGRL